MPERVIIPANIRSKSDLYNYYNMEPRTVRNWLRDLGFDFKKIKTRTIPPAKVKEIVHLLGEK
jgi:hypothetical protein